MAAAKILGISPELVIHPGETITDILEERNLKQKELAQRAGVSEAFLSDVIHGKKDISKGMAMGLEYALGIPSSFWLNLQANYDAELLEIQKESTIHEDEKGILSRIHEIVEYLKKTACIPSDSSLEQTILNVRTYLQVSSLTALYNLAPRGAFRISDKVKTDPYVLGAWLCLCKVQCAMQRLTKVFDSRRVDELVKRIKEIMCSCSDIPQQPLTELLAEYGIDFSVVRNFRGAPVQGFIDNKDDGTYQMVLTIRGAFADIFWFSLFHELGHIVNGDISKSGKFIDATDTNNTKQEEKADCFASNALLNQETYQSFIENGQFAISDIEEYAKTQNVPPYVVIGRLQREGKIPYKWYSKYKLTFKWAEQL